MTRSVCGEGSGDGPVWVTVPPGEVCVGCHCGRVFIRSPKTRALHVNEPGPAGRVHVEASEANLLLATAQAYGVPWLLLVLLTLIGFSLAAEWGAAIGAGAAMMLFPSLVRRFGQQWAWRYGAPGSAQ